MKYLTTLKVNGTDTFDAGQNAWTIDDAELTDGVGGELNTFEELV